MPVDPVLQTMLDQLAANPGPAMSDLPAAAGREMYRAMQPLAPELTVGKVSDRNIEGPGGDLPIRIYHPEGAGPFPVVMNFHGGGWVIGDLDTADSQCREMCRRTDAVVVSVDYRLAPEDQYPAAADDCYAATQWVAEHRAELDSAGQPIAVAGDSAGGNLAAVVAQMARDQNGPELCFQLLVYPVTDCRFDTPSYSENADGYLLTRDTMEWFWNLYAPEPAQREATKASPARATSLADLPPALVLTAQYDPLRDEGEAYGQALQAAGVSTEVIRYDGLVHGFFAMTRTVPAAVPAMVKACDALRAAFARA